jgi:hypothetical protein
MTSGAFAVSPLRRSLFGAYLFSVVIGRDSFFYLTNFLRPVSAT